MHVHGSSVWTVHFDYFERLSSNHFVVHKMPLIFRPNSIFGPPILLILNQKRMTTVSLDQWNHVNAVHHHLHIDLPIKTIRLPIHVTPATIGGMIFRLNTKFLRILLSYFIAISTAFFNCIFQNALFSSKRIQNQKVFANNNLLVL